MFQGLERIKDNFVTIKSFSSIFEAEILNGKLNAYGIESFIQKDDCGGTDPVMHLTLGVHIKVKKNDYDEALALINENDSRKNKNNKPSADRDRPLRLLRLGVGPPKFNLLENQ